MAGRSASPGVRAAATVCWPSSVPRPRSDPSSKSAARMRLSLLFLLLAGFAPSLASQTPPSAGALAARAVDPRVLRAHLEFLADDALEGRRPGTRGGELAAKYIAAQFERLGLKPAGDSGTYFHRVPIITLTPTPTLRAGES